MKIEGKDIKDMTTKECIIALQTLHEENIDVSRQIGCIISTIGLITGFAIGAFSMYLIMV